MFNLHSITMNNEMLSLQVIHHVVQYAHSQSQRISQFTRSSQAERGHVFLYIFQEILKPTSKLVETYEKCLVFFLRSTHILEWKGMKAHTHTHAHGQKNEIKAIY